MLFLDFLTFLGWLGYYWFSTTLTDRIQAVFVYIRDFPGPEVIEVVSGEVQAVQIEMLDGDSPPAYDDLISGEVKENEEDASLPSYEVACEKEEEKGEI